MNEDGGAYDGELVVKRCWCGIAYAMPRTLLDEAYCTGRAICCPLGHLGVYVFGSRAETARSQKRTRAGVCTLCQRTYNNVARHMAARHAVAEVEVLKS